MRLQQSQPSSCQAFRPTPGSLRRRSCHCACATTGQVRGISPHAIELNRALGISAGCWDSASNLCMPMQVAASRDGRGKLVIRQRKPAVLGAALGLLALAGCDSGWRRRRGHRAAAAWSRRPPLRLLRPRSPMATPRGSPSRRAGPTPDLVARIRQLGATRLGRRAARRVEQFLWRISPPRVRRDFCANGDTICARAPISAARRWRCASTPMPSPVPISCVSAPPLRSAR